MRMRSGSRRVLVSAYTPRAASPKQAAWMAVVARAGGSGRKGRSRWSRRRRRGCPARWPRLEGRLVRC